MRYTALVPNLAGLERAQAAGVTEVAIFAAASETFSRKNINQTIDESLETYRAVAARAQSSACACAATCRPRSAARSRATSIPARVADVAAHLIEMGAFEVAVSDTIGIAHPGQVPGPRGGRRARAARRQIALHFHDTRGTALANVLAALDARRRDLRRVGRRPRRLPVRARRDRQSRDRDLIYMLDGLGIRTGVDLDALVEASRFIEPRVGHALPSRYYQAARSRR